MCIYVCMCTYVCTYIVVNDTRLNHVNSCKDNDSLKRNYEAEKLNGAIKNGE